MPISYSRPAGIIVAGVIVVGTTGVGAGVIVVGTTGVGAGAIIIAAAGGDTVTVTAAGGSFGSKGVAANEVVMLCSNRHI